MKTGTLTHLGRYEIGAEIGRGAMGLVYQAHDPKIDRLVAIKTISLQTQEIEEEQEFRERFFLEAKAAGRLVHPGIVTIFDVGEDPENHEPYIVMEFVTGQPLNRILAGENRKLPLGPVLQITQEIAEALNYAHSQNVVHRDVKPANILITLDGHAKIADFGIAKLNQGLMTIPGQVLGSPAYMAPEQLSGETADARSDLFSLGVILYSMLTGFRPFQGNSAATVSFKVVNRDPLPVTSFDAEFPAELDRMVSRAIAKDPAQRYQNGQEMAQEIQRLRERYNLLDQTAASLDCVINPGERTGVVKPPSVRSATPRMAAWTESSSETPNSRPQQATIPKQVAARPQATHRALKIKSSLIPKEIALAAASVLFLAIAFITFEAVRPSKPTARPGTASMAQNSNSELSTTAGASSQLSVDEAVENAASSDETRLASSSKDLSAPHRSVRPTRAKGKAVIKSQNPAPEIATPVPTKPRLPLKAVASTQTVKTTPAPQPAAATLQIQIEYQFAEVEASVWLDNQLIFAQKLYGESKKKALLFKKVEGHDHSNVKVPAGAHHIHVRVLSASDQYDQSQTIAGDFVASSTNVLAITCDKHGDTLQLTLQ